MSIKNENKLLEEIKIILEDIRGILFIVYRDKLEEVKKKLLREWSIKKRIYELCDGTRETSEIAKEIGKNVNYVNSYLSILRREGLVRRVVRNGKIFYEQIF